MEQQGSVPKGKNNSSIYLQNSFPSIHKINRALHKVVLPSYYKTEQLATQSHDRVGKCVIEVKASRDSRRSEKDQEYSQPSNNSARPNSALP